MIHIQIELLQSAIFLMTIRIPWYQEPSRSKSVKKPVWITKNSLVFFFQKSLIIF